MGGEAKKKKRKKKNDFYYKWNENASLTSLNNSQLLIYFSKISRKLLFENWSVGDSLWSDRMRKNLYKK